MTLEERKNGFDQELEKLMEKYGVRSMVADVEIEEGVTSGVWLPGCSEDCDAPEVCFSKNLMRAALNLQEHATDLLEGWTERSHTQD